MNKKDKDLKKTKKLKESKNLKKITKFKEILKLVYEIKPSFLPLTIIESLIAAALPFIQLFFGAKILDSIILRRAETELIQTVLFMVVIIMFLTLIRWGINKILIVMRRNIQDNTAAKIAQKGLAMDFQVLEKTRTQDFLEKAKEGSQVQGGIAEYCSRIGETIYNIVTNIYAAVVLAGFFMSNDGEKNELLTKFVNSYWSFLFFLICIAGLIFLHCYLFRKISAMQYQGFENNVKLNRQVGYFDDCITDYPMGKSIRIYNMAQFIISNVRCIRDIIQNYFVKMSKKELRINAESICLSAGMLLVSYFFIGIKVMSSSVSLGMMMMYANAFIAFNEAVINIFIPAHMLKMSSQYIGNYIKFLNIKNEKYDGTLPIEKRLDNEYELEFKNVSFHYPNSRETVLNHMNIKIKVGKKMAIVGRNGSGKSTFIKLLCRLYDPTEGEILLNGIDIRKYDYDEYRDIFGVVFQDFCLFSFSVGQNVAAHVEYDKERVWKCLSQAGLRERVEKMEHGLDEIIYKLDDEGVEISGGEAQKIVIARALYKDAPVVILDEPTAALDPISELEIYEQFDKMVAEKTAVYISHRMSSCRFCENILVFDNGEIVQAGSHDSLVKQEGLYRELWEAQAQYYA